MSGDSSLATASGEATGVQPDRLLAVRRLVAFSVDWLVIATWGALLFGGVMLVTGGNVPAPPGPWAAQSIGFFSMTLPAILYFAVTESSKARGSLGKRLLGLVVHGPEGRRLAARRALWRNAVKFVPWEFGHVVAQQAAHSATSGLPPWGWAAAVIAFVVPLWWVAELLATGRTPYDRWTRTRVQRHRMP